MQVSAANEALSLCHYQDVTQTMLYMDDTDVHIQKSGQSILSYTRYLLCVVSISKISSVLMEDCILISFTCPINSAELVDIKTTRE